MKLSLQENILGRDTTDPSCKQLSVMPSNYWQGTELIDIYWRNGYMESDHTYDLWKWAFEQIFLYGEFTDYFQWYSCILDVHMILLNPGYLEENGQTCSLWWVTLDTSVTNVCLIPSEGWGQPLCTAWTTYWWSMLSHQPPPWCVFSCFHPVRI